MSAIPEDVASRLRISPISTKMVEGYDGRLQRHPVYDVRLMAAGGGPQVKVRPIAIARSERAIESVVGRDVLAQCRLRYNGLTGEVELDVVGP